MLKARVLMALLCTVVVSLVPASIAAAGSLEDLFPATLGNMQLKRLERGEAALQKIDQLHGKPIHAEAGAVALYVGGVDGEQKAEIWVSDAGSTARAAEQVRIMVEKMLSSPRSPFHGHTLVTRKDPENNFSTPCSLHRFSGMGQSHSIFNTKSLVWWISAAPNVALKTWDVFLFNDH